MPRKAKPKQALVHWEDPTVSNGPKARAVISEHGIKVASKMARAGHSMESIGAAMGVGRESFRGARDRQPELANALDVARGELEQECVATLVTAMRQGQYSAAMFLLKGMFGFREHGEAPNQPAPSVKVNIVIPPRLTDEAYDQIIKDITPETVDGEFEEVPQKRITR